MAQEGNSDMSTKFSTLNVNAMEFVPSFGVPAAPSAPATNATAPETAPAESPVQETAAVEPKSQDASPTKTDEEQPVSVAAATDPIDDKSPDNPGSCSLFVCHNEHGNGIIALETCHRTVSIDDNVFVFGHSGLKRIHLAVKCVCKYAIRFSI